METINKKMLRPIPLLQAILLVLLKTSKYNKLWKRKKESAVAVF